MAYEQELVLLKPGIRAQRIIGAVVSRFEQKTLDVLALKLIQPTEVLIARLYEEHKDKTFYPSLISYMMSEALVAMVVGGENAIVLSRALVGATDPQHALPGSIRGDFGLCLPQNIVHASDSTASAAREIQLFFAPSEVIAIT